MPNNRNLKIARKAKNDEFYTQYEDIAKELPYYKEHLAGKIIYCNCDNPKYSNFYKYLKDSFHEYKLKSLIATYFNPDSYTYKTTFDGQNEIVEPLNSYGDFRSPTCIDILQQADVIVTNPPFSLFREFVSVLTKYDKKFLIIGNVNAIGYKKIFPLFKENNISTGYTNFNVGMYFYVPDSYKKYHKIENGRKLVRVASSCWFTNLPVKKHMEDIVLYRKYSPEIYPKYENYDAINVDRYTEIPCDYDGIMGVPITFIDKYNPEQFEIIGLGSGCLGQNIGIRGIYLEHKQQMTVHSARGDLYYLKNGKPTVPYARILIRKRTDTDSKPPYEQANSPNK